MLLLNSSDMLPVDLASSGSAALKNPKLPPGTGPEWRQTMKWRLIFGDPTTPAHKRSALNSRRVEIPADTEDGLMSVDAAVAIAVANRSTYHIRWTLVEAALVPNEDVVIDWLIPFPFARLAFDPTRIEDPTLQR